jgi:hypothetical protein
MVQGTRMTLMLFSGAWGKNIHKKTWSQNSCDTVPLIVKSFFHITNNWPSAQQEENYLPRCRSHSPSSGRKNIQLENIPRKNYLCIVREITKWTKKIAGLGTNIKKTVPAKKMYLMYYIIRRGNPVICTPWVPIHLSFNRSAGAAPLCLSGCNRTCGFPPTTSTEYKWMFFCNRTFWRPDVFKPDIL